MDKRSSCVVGFLFCWFFFGGIAHFAFTETEAGIIPPWLPAHHALVLISGAGELAGAFLLLVRRARRLAGWGLIALTLAVTPANIFMWQNPGLFPEMPIWLLVARLPFQLVLIGCIWWSTRPAR